MTGAQRRVGSAGGPADPRAEYPDGAALLRALYVEHGPALLSYARRFTAGDHALAEDVVQETLLRAWQHPDALSPDRGSVRPWLFTVAHHILIDLHRARRSRPTEVSDRSLATVPADDLLDRELQAWQVADAVRELRPEHREVLLETYYRGGTVSSAAAALGIPPGTVKSRTYYALRALRLVCEERGITP